MDKLADVVVAEVSRTEKSKNDGSSSEGKPKKSKNEGASNQGSIIEGCFYEINHEKLPRKSPGLLKTIRTVMVNEKTANEVSIIFPSTSSLRKHKEILQVYPELDEEYRMGTTRAAKVLNRVVSLKESMRWMHLKSFWLVCGEVTGSVELRDNDSNQKLKRHCKRVLENSGDSGQRKAEKLIKMKPNKDMQRRSGERFSYSPSPLTMEHLNGMGGQIADRLDLMIADRLDQIADSIVDQVKCLERMVLDRLEG